MVIKWKNYQRVLKTKFDITLIAQRKISFMRISIWNSDRSEKMKLKYSDVISCCQLFLKVKSENVWAFPTEILVSKIRWSRNYSVRSGRLGRSGLTRRSGRFRITRSSGLQGFLNLESRFLFSIVLLGKCFYFQRVKVPPRDLLAL